MSFFRYFILFCALVACFPASAHVGSSGVVFEGKAGNYTVQVYVQPPDVIPGTAKVTVMVPAGMIKSIALKPIYFYAGDEGSPTADPALPVPNEAGRYEGSVWFMDSGSASIQVTIDGNLGKGSVVVPVVAVSTAVRTMPAATGWILLGLGVLLLGLMITIFGASLSDSLLKPGQSDTKQTKRRRVAGSAMGAGFCFALIFIGNNWWNSWADQYKEFMYKPIEATSSVFMEEGQPVLHLRVDSASVRKRSLSYLIPDHGKLMHLFLVRQGTMDAFAHLHPTRIDSLNFRSALPALPAGKYLLYADVVRNQGFAYTITDTLTIPESAKKSTLKTDTDDAFIVTTSVINDKPLLQDQAITVCGKPGVKTKLQDGSSIVWEAKTNEVLQSGKLVNLNFTILDPDGKPAVLQPYLGMMGHAAVFKDDGSVYIHLHPTGTFSSASQQLLEKRIEETERFPRKQTSPAAFRDSIDQHLVMLAALPEAARDHLIMPTMNHGGEHTNHVTFPYVFPKSGKYRVWIQVKRDGQILTGVFDVTAS